MFCSTIIPTVGRETLARAVNSVLDQEFGHEDFEVIVVNDTGRPLPDEDWQHSDRVTLIATHRHERSVARNTGAAIAAGRYLHFLDDDDWMLPGALEHFWKLSQRTNAAFLYGDVEMYTRSGDYLMRLRFNDLEGNCFIQLMAGEWFPTPICFIKSEAFFETGGFNNRINCSEDFDLYRRVALIGDLAGVSEPVAAIGTTGGQTTTPRDDCPRQSHWVRELLIREPGTFKRMRDSARTDYLRGRVVRVYMTSLVWNIRHRYIMTAISRGFYGFAAFLWGMRSFFARDFWLAILRGYENRTVLRGFEEAGIEPH
jgi:glycosyltransferase involved in cell wall biosynthesis